MITNITIPNTRRIIIRETGRVWTNKDFVLNQLDFNTLLNELLQTYQICCHESLFVVEFDCIF